MQKLKLGMFVVLALMLLPIPLLGACGGTSTEAKTLSIGYIESLTGMLAPGLAVSRQGVEAAEEWINDNGGITIDGQQYTIELVLADNKSTPEGTIAAANKLIYENDIKFLLAPAVPWLNIAMAPVSEEAKVLRCLMCGTGSSAEMNPDMPYTFTAFFEIAMIPPSYDYLLEAYPNVKKIAAIAPDEPGGIYFVERSKMEAEKRGLEVVFTENYDLATEDFYPLCTNILDAKPDAVDIGQGVPTMYAGIVKSARELGFTGPLFSGSGIFISVIADLVGRDLAYNLFSSGSDPINTEISPTVNELRRRLAEKPDSDPFQEGHEVGWDSLWFIVQAIEEAQSLDPTEVMESWENMDSIEALYGTTTMGGRDLYGFNHVVMRPWTIVRANDVGDAEVVKVIYPRFE